MMTSEDIIVILNYFTFFYKKARENNRNKNICEVLEQFTGDNYAYIVVKMPLSQNHYTKVTS